ncbi:MAG: hypothetical protein RIR91_1599 [Verrucomicrobiota bacterium]
MSQGRLPVFVGNANVIADAGSFSPATNREISFPDYPLEVKGYIADGFGKDSIFSPFTTQGGSVSIVYVGYDERTVTSGYDYYVYRTPKFNVSVSEDDVINKVWRGAAFTLEADQTTDLYSYVDPGPPVLVSSTSTPQIFTYTFSSSDDPVYGSGDYVAPNSSSKIVYGTEYLYSSFVYTSITPPVAYDLIVTTPDVMSFLITATTPP